MGKSTQDRLMKCALRDSVLVVVEMHGVALGTKVCDTKDLSTLLGFKGWNQRARRMVHRQPRLLHLERRHSRSQLRQSGRSEAPRILHHHQPHRLARQPPPTRPGRVPQPPGSVGRQAPGHGQLGVTWTCAPTRSPAPSLRP